MFVGFEGISCLLLHSYDQAARVADQLPYAGQEEN